RMGEHSRWFTFEVLHTSSRQLDQPLEERRCRSRASGRVPETFPGLVCLPVEAVIEQIEAAEVIVPVHPAVSIDCAGRNKDTPERMPRWITHWMRSTPGDERVHRQWLIRNQAVNFFRHGKDSKRAGAGGG